MIIASQLRSGMAIRYEGQVYKVLAAEYTSGQGKMGGITHTHMRNLETGTQWDHGFRPDLKLEEVSLEKAPMDFLYRDGEQCVFMHPESFQSGGDSGVDDRTASGAAGSGDESGRRVRGGASGKRNTPGRS